MDHDSLVSLLQNLKGTRRESWSFEIGFWKINLKETDSLYMDLQIPPWNLKKSERMDFERIIQIANK